MNTKSRFLISILITIFVILLSSIWNLYSSRNYELVEIQGVTIGYTHANGMDEFSSIIPSEMSPNLIVCGFMLSRFDETIAVSVIDEMEISVGYNDATRPIPPGDFCIPISLNIEFLSIGKYSVIIEDQHEIVGEGEFIVE